ncbi:CAP domain-containing protein [Streptomyces sp. NPDC004244]|uniref:CAP domain-containing protein n=1 Tax=Streptomyces sp. NPDC101206 TaxID=3366128 RepID=UPI0037FB78C9
MTSRAPRTRCLLGPLVAAVLSAALVPVAAPPTAAQGCDTSVLCLINAQRTSRGLPALTVNQPLTNAARQHAVASVQQKWWGPGKDPHRNPQTGSTPQSRIIAAGYCPNPRSWAFAEITYTGWGTGGSPKAAVNWWMNSPGHRAIILDGSLRDAGPWAQAGSADPAGSGAANAWTYVVTFGRCQR